MIVKDCTFVDSGAPSIQIVALKGLDELTVFDNDFIANRPTVEWRKINIDPRTPLKPLAAKLLVVGMGWRR